MEEHKDPGEEINREEEKEQEYSFLQETIKDETISKKKVKKDIFRMAGLGLVFGLVASLSFSAFKPWMDELFQSNPQKVTIPEEEEEADEARRKTSRKRPSRFWTQKATGRCSSL